MKFDIRMDGDKKTIIKRLKTELRQIEDNPLSSWRWWSGFLWGSLLVAALGYGDVWICYGACGPNAPQSEATE